MAFATACVEATEPDDHDHEEPDGVIIRQGATVLVEIDEQNVTGTLTVQQGQETAELTVTFVDHEGDELTPDPSEYYLEVTVVDESVLEWVQDVAGSFSGRVQGTTAGETTLSFSLVHGEVGMGHPDYVSPAVTGTVTP
jgi:hypothetical protein